MRTRIIAAALCAMLAVPMTASRAAAAGKGEQTIIFAGGCFWGVQSVFEHTKGVVSAVSG